MKNSELKNAPPVFGWAIAVAAGALMFGASLVAMGIGANGSVAIGAVVALIVGLIFTIAETKPARSAPAQTAPAPKAASAPAAMAERSTAPAEVTSAPAAAPAAEAAPVAAPVAPPVAAPAPATDSVVAPEKPKGLDAPMGTADDLKRISGVGPVLEGKLNALGFYHFWQIAKWTRSEVEWVDGYLSFKGRIDRDNWIAQAAKLAEDSPSSPPA